MKNKICLLFFFSCILFFSALLASAHAEKHVKVTARGFIDSAFIEILADNVSGSPRGRFQYFDNAARIRLMGNVSGIVVDFSSRTIVTGSYFYKNSTGTFTTILENENGVDAASQFSLVLSGAYPKEGTVKGKVQIIRP